MCGTILTSTGGLVVGHLLHVRNLSHAFLTSDFRSPFTLHRFFFRLTTIRVGLIEAITETNRLGIRVTFIATPLDGLLVAKGILIRIAKDGRCLVCFRSGSKRKGDR